MTLIVLRDKITGRILKSMAGPKRMAWVCEHTDRPNWSKGKCQLCYRKDWQADPKNKLGQRFYRLKLKLEAFDAYGGRFCACCGETEYHFLSLDHINGDGAEDRRKRYGDKTSSGGGDFYRHLKNEGYPTGFQVLCHNCNLGRSLAGGLCPHQFEKFMSTYSTQGEDENMGWESVSVSEVQVTEDKTGFTPIPNGTYGLTLMGAEESKFNAGSTNVTFMVADGEFAGRRIFLDIPDPDRISWAPEVYARIVQALGAEVQPYTSPVTELNRLSQNGHSKLMADVFIETYTKKDGTPGSKNKIRYRSLRPAA